MPFSTHYYVLSLSDTTNALFEAFRDSLIEVENQGFPVVSPAGNSEVAGQERRGELVRMVDRCFGRYHTRDPLRVVIVGTREMQAAFSAVTDYAAAIIGRVEGDHTTTSTRDLGQIVWPVVREAMSGVLERAVRDFKALEKRGSLVSGLEAVARVAGQSPRDTLLVEDDYRLRGGIRATNRAPGISSEVDIRDAIDDAVDGVIEIVLESGGRVVFAPSGTLRDRERIVLLRRSSSP